MIENAAATFSETAYLALGSNLGDREYYLRAALDGLAATPEILVATTSSFLQTVPIGGPPGQDDYLNGVVEIETTLTPQALLARCLEIEREQHRERGVRWGPRTLDIDLLLYGNLVIEEPKLTVPHPRLRERWFVLAPLSEIAPPTLALPPDGMLLRDLLARDHGGETSRPSR